jgi:hypothetical protein
MSTRTTTISIATEDTTLHSLVKALRDSGAVEFTDMPPFGRIRRFPHLYSPTRLPLSDAVVFRQCTTEYQHPPTPILHANEGWFTTLGFKAVTATPPNHSLVVESKTDAGASRVRAATNTAQWYSIVKGTTVGVIHGL